MKAMGDESLRLPGCRRLLFSTQAITVKERIIKFGKLRDEEFETVNIFECDAGTSNDSA